MEDIGHGVCRLSLMSVRGEPSHRAEQTNQLLFGEHYSVVANHEDGKWLRIRSEFDSYEGWVDGRQHHAVSKEYFDHVNNANFKITTDTTSTLLYNKIRMTILMGSIIPISVNELFRLEEQFAFNGEARGLGQRATPEVVKSMAVKYLNAPYIWGGKSPFGIDCSGFTQTVFKICGYRLLRDSYQQANQGKSVSTVKDARIGDLAFFDNNEGKVVHTGIFFGEGKIIHASGNVRIDVIREDGIQNVDSGLITHRLCSIRRVIPYETGQK